MHLTDHEFKISKFCYLKNNSVHECADYFKAKRLVSSTQALNLDQYVSFLTSELNKKHRIWYLKPRSIRRMHLVYYKMTK